MQYVDYIPLVVRGYIMRCSHVHRCLSGDENKGGEKKRKENFVLFDRLFDLKSAGKEEEEEKIAFVE